jgi:MYXO-CTERM domain-containing protein
MQPVMRSHTLLTLALLPLAALSTGFANDKAAYDFFVGKGLTSYQAAGIVGNLDQESGVDPNAVQYNGGPGRGIAQWSVGGRWDTSGNDNATWYAGQQGESVWSLNLQLEFIWYELTNIGYGFADLKATNNVTDATVVFQDKFEICGQCDSNQRIAYAMDVLNAYGTAPSYAAGYVSQSWPLATNSFTIQCGQDVPANIVLRNTGSKSWDGNTKFATTQPRDRSSIFAAAGWPAPNRLAVVNGAVAPNATFQFDFVFHGPTGNGCVPGDYHEFFGMVEEGVTWFSDPGQGGPPDNQFEAWIKLVPGPPVEDMAHGSAEDMAHNVVTDGGTGSPDAGTGGGADLAQGNDVHGGCSMDGGRGGSTWPALVLLLVAGLGLRRRKNS